MHNAKIKTVTHTHEYESGTIELDNEIVDLREVELDFGSFKHGSGLFKPNSSFNRRRPN